MIRRFFLFLFLAVTASIGADRPNFIIVMPDDMGYGDTGATGNSVIRTPNLDRLAEAGASLTDFYVSPVCSPTRACLMTGRYNYRTRVIDTFKGRSMMEPDEVTIAEALREQGYATGIFGKWHLGDNYPLRPQDQGFDEVLIHRGGGLAQRSEPIENAQRYTDPILFHNGEKAKREGYCTDIYFDAAIEFMQEAKDAGKPFFVYLPPNAPHGPYHDVPKELLQYYESVDLTPILNGNTSEKHRDTVARVFAMIENIDQNMGKLDAYLKQSEQFENTLVMFFTDNGPNTMRYVGPFRGMKSNVYEGGIRTMFWARWPSAWAAGTVVEEVAAHIDLFPTLFEAAGGDASEYSLDGRSLLPLLTKKPADWKKRAVFIQSHRGDVPVEYHNFAVRQQEWKLVRATGFGSEEVKEEKPFELYRVSEDPGEAKNLAQENPEKVRELKKAYRDWLEDVSTTRQENYEPPRIVIGAEQEPESDLSIQDWRVAKNAVGWGDGGTWHVKVVDAGPYDAEIRWEKPVGARDLVLRVGEKEFQSELQAGQTKAVFPEINLSEGESVISVEMSGKIKREDVLRFLTLKVKNS